MEDSQSHSKARPPLLVSEGVSSLLPSIFGLCYLGVAQKVSMIPWERLS